MKLAALVAMLGTAGCDSLFNLDRVPPAGGSETDARPVDAPDDGDALPADDAMPACIPGLHDEDGDGLMDGCDPCPTSINTSTTNVDGDALPAGCDPDLGTGQKDKIVFYTGFANATDLDDNFTKTGSIQYNSGGGGIVAFSGMLTMKTAYVPTKIELITAGLTGAAATDEAIITAPNAVCHVHHRGCGTSSSDTSASCVQMDGSSGNGGMAGDTNGLSKVELYRTSSAMFCYITSGGKVSDQANRVFAPGQLSISTTAGSTLSIKSVVIYGSGP
jgi:hypothetical protein